VSGSADDGGAKAAYEEWHRQLDVDAEANAPWHLLVREHLDVARDLVGKRVLEIGCGRGGFSCWLAAQSGSSADIVASDFSSTAVEKGAAFALKRGITGVTWEVGDIQRISHESGSFDTVISCETIEHVPDPALAVRELARVLRPGGRLFLTTPNYLGTTGVYRGYLRLTGRRFREEGQPINNFNMLPRTIRWVKRAGLRVRTVAGRGHYVQIPGRNPVRVHAMDRAQFVTRWAALHSFVLAQKPTGT